MEKKILQELKNITKQLKNISNNTKTKDESELAYSTDDAIGFIYDKLFIGNPVSKKDIKLILEAEEGYVRSVGIIDD